MGAEPSFGAPRQVEPPNFSSSIMVIRHGVALAFALTATDDELKKAPANAVGSLEVSHRASR